jgi:hypothetical protein
MELIGEENKIRALFSEGRLVDEQITPSFAAGWNRAQSKTLRPRRAFNLSFVAATVLLVCSLISLAWWASRSQPSDDNATVANVPPVTTVGPKIVAPPRVPGVEGFRPSPARLSNRSRAVKLATRREASLVAANRKAASEAKAIASWQSPTATLLDSSSDELIKSLPQLNQSSDELKSFLPSRPK